MKKSWILLLAAWAALAAGQAPLYKDASAPVERRVADLLSRMTVEEKVGQLLMAGSADTAAFDADGNYVGVQDTAVLNRGVGSFWAAGPRRPGPGGLAYQIRCRNGLQRWLLEKSRLGIPVLGFGEALHGYMAPGAVSFPQAVALGCTWDTLLVERVFTAAAAEASAMGTRQVLAPVVDLGRDPRWGRTEETYGEDPYLVSRMAVAAVFGFQGRGAAATGRIDADRVAVTLKHFAGHGQPEGGRNIAPVNFSERVFRETHLRPFEAAVREARARSIMASYNEWDGVPNHVNHKLLTGILRGEWGFDGFVMSDGGGIDVVVNDHHAAADLAEAGRMCLEAGIDFELGRGAFGPLPEAVRDGRVSMAALDRAAAGVLRVKFELGLFDDPYTDPDAAARIVNCPGHRALAREAAREAAVLLKNENRTLPFDSTAVRTLAVIGPDAADIHLGGYSNTPMAGVSVLEGLKEFCGNRIRLVYAEGCRITTNPECDWRAEGNPVLSDPADDRRRIAEAVRAAKKADAVVLVLGENELINREAWAENHLGDRDDLNLVGSQDALARAVIAAGRPTAVLLFNGRPLAVNELTRMAPALMECWYLGQETGRAVADLLFGRVSPSGKLTMTFPRSVGDLPCYYNRKPSMHRDYVLAEPGPLFPFGYGLSYASFTYAGLRVEPAEMPAGGRAEASVEVTNAGNRTADEIVQLYVTDRVSFPTRPVMELKDFARIRLAPGETRTVRFAVTPDKLEAAGMDMKRRVEPGDFTIRVGSNSAETLEAPLRVTRP
jgi:beta-glucosidase